MKGFYYVYVLLSEKDRKQYIGYTQNVDLRFEQHENGEVESTRYRRPLRLIYFEGCMNKEDALRREKYFKTHYGKMYLRRRLRNWNKERSSNLISQG